MSTLEPPSRGPAPLFPRGLAWAIVLLLSLQLGLGYLQGALLHRQHAELQSLRADIQDLADAIDDSTGNSGGEVNGGRSLRPGRGPLQGARAPRLVKTSHVVLDPGPEDEDKLDEKNRKEMKEVQDSAKKAVADARKAQSQLSLSENARKAEEKAKLEAAQSQWQKGALAATALVVLALLLRAWWRRRG